jgi:hypothetical protein
MVGFTFLNFLRNAHHGIDGRFKRFSEALRDPGGHQSMSTTTLSPHQAAALRTLVGRFLHDQRSLGEVLGRLDALCQRTGVAPRLVADGVGTAIAADILERLQHLRRLPTPTRRDRLRRCVNIRRRHERQVQRACAPYVATR